MRYALISPSCCLFALTLLAVACSDDQQGSGPLPDASDLDGSGDGGDTNRPELDPSDSDPTDLAEEAEDAEGDEDGVDEDVASDGDGAIDGAEDGGAADADAASDLGDDAGAGDASADMDADASADADVSDAMELVDASDASDASDAVGDSTDVADAAPDLDDGGADLPGEPDLIVEETCKSLGGICLGTLGDCSTGSGRHLSEGDDDCVFDDGAGVCCAPPQAQDTGVTCEARGGLCAPIAGCNFVDGSFAPPAEDCPSFPGIICCLPESVCGVEDVVCCGETVAFRPTCDRGDFTCDLFPDTELVPRRSCVF